MRSLPVVAALALTGCVHLVPLRASSTTHVRDSEARQVFPLREPELVQLLSAKLAERGFPLAQKVPVSKLVTYYIYKGKRRALRDLRGGPHSGYVYEEHEVGSWFAARVVGGDKPFTELLLIGKPTIDGTEVCADSDQLLAEAQYWCRDTKVRDDYAKGRAIDGREEAETVRGVLDELRRDKPL